MVLVVDEERSNKPKPNASDLPNENHAKSSECPVKVMLNYSKNQKVHVDIIHNCTHKI